MRRILITSTSLLCVIATVVYALYMTRTTAAQTLEPLAITDGVVNNGVFTANIKNVSPKPITAYALIIKAHDRGGKQIGLDTVTDFSDPAKLPTSALAPGTSERMKPLPVPSNSVGLPAVAVDYIRFLDGTTWGPDSEKQSLRIAGMETGVKAARAHLRSILHSKGTQAVVDELSR